MACGMDNTGLPGWYVINGSGPAHVCTADVGDQGGNWRPVAAMATLCYPQGFDKWESGGSNLMPVAPPKNDDGYCKECYYRLRLIREARP